MGYFVSLTIAIDSWCWRPRLSEFVHRPQVEIELAYEVLFHIFVHFVGDVLETDASVVFDEFVPFNVSSQF